MKSLMDLKFTNSEDSGKFAPFRSLDKRVDADNIFQCCRQGVGFLPNDK